MKKNDIFTFTAHNGVEVQAVVIGILKQTNGSFTDTLICYSQNKIFTFIQHDCAGWDTKWKSVLQYKYSEVLVDYAILPDYDELLARYNDIEVAQTETNLGM